MNNIFKNFINSRSVKTPLDFGHNKNVFIESIDFNERKRNGIKIKANTFIRLTKIDPDTKKSLASTELSFWDLDPTKDFVYDNFISQFSILTGIIDALGGDIEAYESKVLDVVEGDDDSSMLQWLKNNTNAKAAQAVLVTGFKEQVEDKIGDRTKLLKCKMVSNKAGYLQPATDIMWILPMDSEEELPIITAREKAVYEKSLSADKKAKPDSTGNAPAAEKVVSANSLASI